MVVELGSCNYSSDEEDLIGVCRVYNVDRIVAKEGLMLYVEQVSEKVIRVIRGG